MTNYADKASAKALNRLFERRDDNGDFSVKMRKGSSMKIHSWILELHSEVLGTMVSADFKEKKEKLIVFPKYSDLAVASFIKFLYGFELNHGKNINYEAVLHLIEMGGVYNVREVQDAAANAIEKYLTKKNVFEAMQVCKENNAEEAVDICAKFVVKNFDKKTLFRSGKVKLFPEVALKFIEDDVTSGEPLFKHSIISVPDHLQRINLSKYLKTSGSIKFRVDKMITITGIGLMLSKDTNVTVQSSFYQKGDSIHEETQEVTTNKESYKQIMFESPHTYQTYLNEPLTISIDLTGSGTVYRTNNFGSKNQGQVVERSVEGRNICGMYASQVKFSFIENSFEGIITDISFYVYDL